MGDFLVICDGSVPGLLGLAKAAHLSGGSRFWVPPSGPGTAARSQAAARAAALYDIVPSESPALAAFADLELRDDARVAMSLVAAAFAARESNLDVLWPITGVGGPDSVMRASENLSRATLIGRLASLGGPAVTVETPFVDFTDEAVADLILDMDLPIWTCWWFEPHSLEVSLQAAAAAEREHWTTMLHKAGWRGPLPNPPSPVVA